MENVILRRDADVETYVNKFSEKFEGLIIRDPNSPYKFGRARSGLFKYKLRDTDKAIILDIIPVTKTHEGIIFQVRHPITNAEFEITGSGPKEYQLRIYKDKDEYIGKKIEYYFTGKTQDQIPREATIRTVNEEYVLE